jgi:hypothetical protein
MAQVSPAFVTLFEAEVKQAYQGEQLLAGTTRIRTGVEGSSVKFPKIAAGVAQSRIPQTDVTPLNVAYSQVTCTLSDWIAAEYSDIFNQAKVNFNDRAELVQVVAKAIGRRIDQMKIDAIDGASTSLTVSTDIGGTGSNLNVTKLRKAKELLDTNNVPPSDRHILVHASNLSSLLSETAVTSEDFNTVKALVQGDLNTFMGFNFHMIGDRSEGGLAKPSTRTVLAWQKDAVGYAEGFMKSEINYVPEKTSWLVSSMLSAGAIGIDAGGIVEISCTES